MQMALTILAQDIMENSYINSFECPITRALHRAGYPEYRDIGTRIEKGIGTTIVSRYTNKDYEELSDKVVAMYRTKDNLMGEKLPIEDFTITINYD